MDSETKTVLLVLAAVAGGVALGWCLKMHMRKPRSTGGAARAMPASDDGQAVIPVDVGGAASCGGCRA